MKKGLLFTLLGTAVVVLAVFAVYQNMGAKGYVTISINPEVQLEVDANNKVVGYNALNEDADVLMSDLEVVGLDIDAATKLILDSAMEAGYLDEYTAENAIIITAVKDNDEEQKELEAKVMANVKAHLEEKKVYAVQAAVKLGDALKEEATALEISNGKMLLIETAVKLNPALVKADLAKLTVKEIQAEIKTVVKERHDALKTSKEELKTEWQAKKAELKADYRQEVDALKNELKTNIANYDKLTAKDQIAKVKEVIATKKVELRTKLATIKQEVKTYVEENNYTTVKENVVDTIRAVIRKGN